MRSKIINLLLIAIFVFQIFFLFGQNKFLNIGIKNNGICFGNSSEYNGLRINLWDKNTLKINGVNLSVWSETSVLNGISIGLLTSQSSIANGIQIGGLGASSNISNGIAIGGLGLGGRKRNGVGLGGLFINCDTLNGFFIETLGVAAPEPSRSNKIINGFAFGIIGVGADKVKGLMMSLYYTYSKEQYGVSIACYNQTDNLHGFQFGLLNYAGNNRIFRWMPIMNFNFRKKPAGNNKV